MFGFKKKMASGKGHSLSEIQGTVRKSFDLMEYKYEVDESGNVICDVMGDDIPMRVVAASDESSIGILVLMSFTVDESHKAGVLDKFNTFNNDIRYGRFYLHEIEGGYAPVFQYSIPDLVIDLKPDVVATFVQMSLETVDKVDGDIKQMIESDALKKSSDFMYI